MKGTIHVTLTPTSPVGRTYTVCKGRCFEPLVGINMLATRAPLYTLPAGIGTATATGAATAAGTATVPATVGTATVPATGGPFACMAVMAPLALMQYAPPTILRMPAR